MLPHILIWVLSIHQEWAWFFTIVADWVLPFYLFNFGVGLYAKYINQFIATNLQGPNSQKYLVYKPYADPLSVFILHTDFTPVSAMDQREAIEAVNIGFFLLRDVYYHDLALAYCIYPQLSLIRGGFALEIIIKLLKSV